MNRACLFHAYKGESDCSSRDSLLAKVVSCAISVVKANRVQVEPLQTVYEGI